MNPEQGPALWIAGTFERSTEYTQFISQVSDLSSGVFTKATVGL